MKKSIIFQSVITILLIIIVGAFGVYALLISNADRKSQVMIDIKDQSIDITISGSTSWGSESFETKTDENGIVHQIWEMDDLVLTEENAVTPQTFSLKMDNFNRNANYEIKVKVQGVGFDENNRFQSEVQLLCDETAVNSQVITKDQRVFEDVFTGTAESFELIFKYTLKTLNSSFNVGQNIHVHITTQWRA